MKQHVRWKAVFAALMCLLLILGVPVRAQSLWVETGLAYDETSPREFDAGLAARLRGTFPLGEVPGLYVAAGWQHGLALDAGGWFRFRPGPDDPFGLRSYLGAGLGYAGGEFGLALTLALSYDLTPDLALVLAYTHRPILLPRSSQRFDLSAGLKIALE